MPELIIPNASSSLKPFFIAVRAYLKDVVRETQKNLIDPTSETLARLERVYAMAKAIDPDTITFDDLNKRIVEVNAPIDPAIIQDGLHQYFRKRNEIEGNVLVQALKYERELLKRPVPPYAPYNPETGHVALILDLLGKQAVALQEEALEHVYYAGSKTVFTGVALSQIAPLLNAMKTLSLESQARILEGNARHMLGTVDFYLALLRLDPQKQIEIINQDMPNRNYSVLMDAIESEHYSRTSNKVPAVLEAMETLPMNVQADMLEHVSTRYGDALMLAKYYNSASAVLILNAMAKQSPEVQIRLLKRGGYAVLKWALRSGDNQQLVDLILERIATFNLEQRREVLLQPVQVRDEEWKKPMAKWRDEYRYPMHRPTIERIRGLTSRKARPELEVAEGNHAEPSSTGANPAGFFYSGGLVPQGKTKCSKMWHRANRSPD